MFGKDHQTNAPSLSTRSARSSARTPPEHYVYELFLDEQGQKISKSKGNGLTIDEWLTYASPESLALYMFQRPREAKKLHFDVIPRAVDEYLQFLGGYDRQDWKNRLGNPVWHIHGGDAAGAGADRSGRWGQCGQDAGHLRPADEPRRGRQFRGQGGALGLPAALCAVNLAADPSAARCAGRLRHRLFPRLREAGKELPAGRRNRDAPPSRLSTHALATLPQDASAEMVQDTALDVARAIPRYQNFAAKNATPERPGVSGEWWKAIYQVMFGEDQGPRFGSFAAIYGLANTRALIAKALSGGLVAEHAAFVEARKSA